MILCTFLQAVQSLPCLSHLFRTSVWVSLGGRLLDVAPPAQPTSPPAFSCSHLLKAWTALQSGGQSWSSMTDAVQCMRPTVRQHIVSRYQAQRQYKTDEYTNAGLLAIGCGSALDESGTASLSSYTRVNHHQARVCVKGLTAGAAAAVMIGVVRKGKPVGLTGQVVALPVLWFVSEGMVLQASHVTQ